MSKLLLELHCFHQKPVEPGGRWKDMAQIYLWDEEGNRRELRPPEEFSFASLGFVDGFISQWPMETKVTWASSSDAGVGYRLGHIDAINLRESYGNLSGGFLGRLLGRRKKALEEFFWTSQPST